MSTVIGIFLHKEKGQPLERVESATVTRESGIEGDSHGIREDRQILVVDAGAIAHLGLEPGDLREQISITGLEGFEGLPAGARLSIGNGTFEITKPCGPCLLIGEYNGQEDVEAFRSSLENRRGMFVRFVGEVHDSEISVGDEVRIFAS